MKITISHEAPSAFELAHLYTQAGFLTEVDLDNMNRVVKSTSEWISVRDESGSLLGIGRLITDYVRYGFIVDVIIEESHQRKGIGTKIMKSIIYQCRELELDGIHLWPTEGKALFYQKLGFLPYGSDQPHMKLDLEPAIKGDKIDC